MQHSRRPTNRRPTNRRFRNTGTQLLRSTESAKRTNKTDNNVRTTELSIGGAAYASQFVSKMVTVCVIMQHAV